MRKKKGVVTRICEEFESMLLFEDVEDIPASFEEVEELLNEFETVKEVPLDWVLKKHGIDQSFDDTSYVGMEPQKTEFNGQFYALTDMDDWFDMNNSILSVGDNERRASLAERRLSIPGPFAALRNQLSGMSTPVRNKINSVYDTPYSSLRRKSFGIPSGTVQHTPSDVLRRMSFGTPSVRFEDCPTINTPLSAIFATSIQQDSELESFNLFSYLEQVLYAILSKRLALKAG